MLLALVAVLAAYVLAVEASNLANPGLSPIPKAGFGEAKEKVDMAIEKLQDDIGNAADIQEIERLEKSLAGAMELRRTMEISERLNVATGEEKERLEAELRESMDRLREYTGDRRMHTVIAPDQVWPHLAESPEDGG